MSTPESPTSPASSAGSEDLNRSMTLEDLVTLFVASKRSLNTQTALWRANETVTSARELLEENAVLVAKNTSLRSIVGEQVDALEAVGRGIATVGEETQSEFKSLLHDVDTAHAGLQSTLSVLRDTPIEPTLQPPGTPQKHLLDFIDNSSITGLRDSLHACIDQYNEARSSLTDSQESLDISLSHLHHEIDNIPTTSTTSSSPSPVPALYRELEEHAKETAQAFQSLVRHYDLCVTALKHTEGGSAAAYEAVGDTPMPSGGDLSSPNEPMTEDERREMLGVLQKDSLEVDDVVAEIRDRGSEMALLLSQIEAHLTTLREQDTALNQILQQLSTVIIDSKSYISRSRSFFETWLEDIRPVLVSGIEEWDNQREFYERYDLAYAKLLVEIAARRKRHEKARRKAEEAQKELDRLYAEDRKARQHFELSQGDFLPQDIWRGLKRDPKRYEVRPVTEAEAEDGEDDAGDSIPQLPRNVVERALARVKTRP